MSFSHSRQTMDALDAPSMHIGAVRRSPLGDLNATSLDKPRGTKQSRKILDQKAASKAKSLLDANGQIDPEKKKKAREQSNEYCRASRARKKLNAAVAASAAAPTASFGGDDLGLPPLSASFANGNAYTVVPRALSGPLASLQRTGGAIEGSAIAIPLVEPVLAPVPQPPQASQPPQVSQPTSQQPQPSRLPQATSQPPQAPQPTSQQPQPRLGAAEAALLSAWQRMGQLSPDDSVRLLSADGVSLEHGLATFLAFGKALQAAAASSSSGYGATQLLPELDQRMEDGDDSDDPEQQTSPISLRLAAERLAAKQNFAAHQNKCKMGAAPLPATTAAANLD